MKKTIKIVSWNICRHNPWSQKSREVLETLKDLRPDLVCLQEVSGEGAEIEKALGYFGLYSLTMNYQKKGNLPKMTGLGILTLKTVDNKEHFFVPFDASDGEIYQSGFLIIKYENLWVVNSHLGNKYETRYKNVEQLLNWVEENISINESVILCGDLNTNKPDEDTIQKIIKKGFKDLWGLVNVEKCVTYYSSDWWTSNFPDSSESLKIKERTSSFPDSTLDYIFIKGKLSPKSCQLVHKVPSVSDHLGLYGEMLLDPPAGG